MLEASFIQQSRTLIVKYSNHTVEHWRANEDFQKLAYPQIVTQKLAHDRTRRSSLLIGSFSGNIFLSTENIVSTLTGGNPSLTSSVLHIPQCQHAYKLFLAKVSFSRTVIGSQSTEGPLFSTDCAKPNALYSGSRFPVDRHGTPRTSTSLVFDGETHKEADICLPEDCICRFNFLGGHDAETQTIMTRKLD